MAIKSKQFLIKINSITVGCQKEIIDRLKLYDFAKSAISSYCKNQTVKLNGYEFKDFKKRFKLVDFKRDKEIKSVNYKNMVSVGNSIVQNELADSVFILNTSTFENWLLNILRQIYLFDRTYLYSDQGNNQKETSGAGQIDISFVKEASSIEELWEKIVDKYLFRLPYDGIKSNISKVLKVYGIEKSVIPQDTIDKINELCLCRNAIVHNQKIISEDYTKKAGKMARFKKDEHISITEEILFDQADNQLKFMQDLGKISKFVNADFNN